MKNRGYFIIVLLFLAGVNVLKSQTHPHLLVTDSDKAQVLGKIEGQAWASAIFSRMSAEVTPYVERHKTDPEWILSRYLMNRIPGKRYTRAIADIDGTELIRWEGDAPFPTVRVSPHKRGPVTPTGGSYDRPSLEELIPYDTSRFMHMVNEETQRKELIDPRAMVGDINGEINSLALTAAIIYWLKGDEAYAKFAADILDQWAKGAYYQEPIIGPCRTGFLDVQTLGDAAYRSLILAYDFVSPYMKQKGYDLHYYESVFGKFASTLAFRGFWNNNWYAAESSTMVCAALSLENKTNRDYYLQFFLDKDTINGSCGQLALPSTVEKWLTPDGHWKEPGGYHNFPVSNLLISSMILEKNGYDIFRKFPALFRASYAMLKYSFPNLTVSAFGDTGRASQSPESLEIGLIAAVKLNAPELPEMLSSMKKLIEEGRYKRENSGFMGLLCYIPDLPEAKSDYTWPRSATLDFAKYFLQRNGMDPKSGLMYGVQGASYNHNHNNGMAMELYGMGEVMGIDAGTGPNYEHPYHVNYYSQWAAHNTVAAAGMSGSVPFAGTAGRKEIGQIELAAMEPLPEKKAVSPFCSFTDTRYNENSTNTFQKRTLALIRTSDKSGYYVDIYRSYNAVSNDYIYHNIGSSVTFLDKNRNNLDTKASAYPLKGDDHPGFRYYKDVRRLDNCNQDVVALFSIKDADSADLFMQVLMPSAEGRTYFTAKSLKTKTSGRVYSGKYLPLITMHDEGESSTKPFIAVFEPYAGRDGYTVESVTSEKTSDPGAVTALKVLNRDRSSQLILQSDEPGNEYSSDEWNFKGYFGVAGFSEKSLNYLYLGQGNLISCKGYSVSVDGNDGSAFIQLDGKSLKVTCNQPVRIGIPVPSRKKVQVISGNIKSPVKVERSGKGAIFTLPASENAVVILK